MLKQNKKLHFWFKSSIFALLAFSIAFSTLPTQLMAAWTGSCAGFVNGTNLTVNAGQTCTLTGAGSANAVTVNAGGTLIIGDDVGDIAGSLTATSWMNIYGDLIVADTTADSTIDADFAIRSYANGNIDNFGFILVDGGAGNYPSNDLVMNDSSVFNNQNGGLLRVMNNVHIGNGDTQSPTFNNLSGGLVHVGWNGASSVGDLTNNFSVYYDSNVKNDGIIIVDKNASISNDGVVYVDSFNNNPLNTPTFINNGVLEISRLAVSSNLGTKSSATFTNASGGTLNAVYAGPGYESILVGHNGTLINSSGATDFTSSGRLHIDGQLGELAQFTNNELATINGNLVLGTYGNLTNTSTLNVNSLLGAGINFGANSDFNNSGDVQMKAYTQCSDCIFDNSGNFEVGESGTPQDFYIQNPASVVNNSATGGDQLLVWGNIRLSQGAWNNTGDFLGRGWFVIQDVTPTLTNTGNFKLEAEAAGGYPNNYIEVKDNAIIDNNVGGIVDVKASIKVGDGATDNPDFNNLGTVNADQLLLGDSPTHGGTYTADSGSNNNVNDIYVGDPGITGGTLVIENGSNISLDNLILRNDGTLTNNSDFTVDVDLTVENGATIANTNTLTVSGRTNVYDDGTIFTNNGILNTDILYVGESGSGFDGGEYINTGVTNVLHNVLDDLSIEVYEGKITNNNTDLGVTSFIYESVMWMSGTASETSIFQNFGVVDAGQDNLSMRDYSLLDLDGGRFVMNEEGCGAIPPNAGYINARSSTGNAADVLIDIASGATLSVGYFEIGDATTDAKIVNAGIINDVDLAGASKDCSIDILLVKDSEFDNNAGGLIDLWEGEIVLQNNSVFNNANTASITGVANSQIKLNDDNVVFNHDGIIDIASVSVVGTSGPSTVAFNASGTSSTTLEGLLIGDENINVGGNATFDDDSTLVVTNQIEVLGYGVLNLDSNDVNAGSVLIDGGDTDGGGTINMTDPTPGIYNFDFLGLFAAKVGYTNSVLIDTGVEVNLLTPLENPNDGNYYSSVFGGFDPDGGENVLTLNGILNIPNDLVNAANFYLGDGGKVDIGVDGFLDIDEEDGQLVVASTASLIDNSDNPLTEGIDVEGECLLDGSAVLNNRMDCVNLVHVQANGDVDVGLDGVVTVEGSETIVDGFIELDGIWNAGDLTVNNGGHITSGDDPTYDETNFLLNVEDLTINAGGKIASDGVSSRGVHVDGSGSYGGEGEGRGTGSVYGIVKMDAASPALYGETGMNGGVPDAGGNGGGAVRIYSTGNITVDGQISANASNSTVIGGGGGSGGTVIIEHVPTDPGAFFTGSSPIMAAGNGSDTDSTVEAGGGGRISIISPLLDYANWGRYDLKENGGEVFATSGIVDDGLAPVHYAAAGTMFFGGDIHNPLGALIVEQQGSQDASPETTYIPNTGDNDFDKIEVLGAGVVDFQADPGAPTVCYQTDGTITFPTLNCDDYKWSDKPHALFVNTRATGAQGADLFQEPGYQVADGVSNDDLFVQDLIPAFSFIHSNPSDPAAIITQIQIQVDDDADFSSPVWDYLKADLTRADEGDVVDGARTEDIIYNEDASGTALIDGITYYIRSQFVNAPGLWSHADYNNQWKFIASAAPFVPPPAGAPANNNGPGGGSRVIPYQEPAEEPIEEQEQAGDAPTEEPAEEPASEGTELRPSAPESEPEQGSEISYEPESQKVPRKPRPAAPEEEPIETATTDIGDLGETTFACSRAGVTEAIIHEFDLRNIFNESDIRCQEDFENCMLPFLINSSYDVTSESYFPDLILEGDLVGDANPLPAFGELVSDANPLPAREEDLVGDANPLPARTVEAIEFGTRNRMVQGYYDEENSPFRPLATMSRVEILKLLNFVIGLEWKYFDEYVAEIGGEENLQNVVAKAGDITEWWHVRYYNYACENGLVPCDPFYDFEPDADCTDEWLSGLVAKYKKFYNDRGLDEVHRIDDDNDSISNKDEEVLFFTDPQLEDTDGDELDDGDELFVHNTNPLLKDTDFDGLDDGAEINKHQTDPTRLDTDGDGASDFVEIKNGTDPRDPLDTPDLEVWKGLYDIDLVSGSQDSDLDGLSDLLEYKYGTDPLNPDTDGDGLTDADEILLYGTDPLTETDLSELGVMITNLKNGMILTDLRPLIQGIAPNPEMEVLLILRNEYGHELQLGKTTTDEKGAFIMIPEFDLRDGEFFLFAKALDPENSQVLNSPMVKVSVDSSLNVEKPTPERLADKLITDDILLKELEVEVGSKMPTLSGKTGYQNQVIATWQSAVGVSSIIADISAGEFHITAPIELPYGSHKVSAYAIRESDQAMSKIVGIPFNIKETEKQVISFEPTKADSSYILYIVLGVIVVLTLGLVYYIRSRKVTKAPDVDSSGTEDSKNPNQTKDEKDVM